ncbi:MAG: hypothetical protein MT490_05680 [Sphingomonas sp.]|uniref:hypothetical protein n=1 Tax=Sphingomonas sp. TaxID=28214 RepID=UPI0022765325|nr:hypothetical protein [Sphingomonas sp.]MCX8475272.1 hypothetical protein [Sphingomonas sp.]
MTAAAVSDGDLARVIDVYANFITEIFRRLDAVDDSITELKANSDHPNCWQNCDFCWFQIRKICEYLTLAVVAAHHFDGHPISSLSKWRPKELLADVARLSEHPTPVAIADLLAVGPDGGRQFTPVAKPVRADLISQIYGRCSDILHVGSLDRILAEKLPTYEIAQLDRWLVGFRSLLSHHMLLLPGIKTVLICRSEGGERMFFALASEGAIFDTSHLPDFDFDQND